MKTSLTTILFSAILTSALHAGEAPQVPALSARGAHFQDLAAYAKKQTKPHSYASRDGSVTYAVYIVKHGPAGVPAYTLVISTKRADPGDWIAAICDTATISPLHSIVCNGRVITNYHGFMGVGPGGVTEFSTGRFDLEKGDYRSE